MRWWYMFRTTIKRTWFWDEIANWMIKIGVLALIIAVVSMLWWLGWIGLGLVVGGLILLTHSDNLLADNSGKDKKKGKTDEKSIW